MREELQKYNSIYEVCFAFRVFIHKHNDYITTSAQTMAWKGIKCFILDVLCFVSLLYL